VTGKGRGGVRLSEAGEGGVKEAGFGLTQSPSSPSLQPSSPGSEMVFWPLALVSSPSCRVTWVGKLLMVSVDPPCHHDKGA
jgi:hypothetical protein